MPLENRSVIKDIGALRQLCDRLNQAQWDLWYPQGRGRYSSWKVSPSEQARELWDRLINHLFPIDQKVFEQAFPISANELHVDFSQQNVVLYLPPLKRHAEFVPILDMKCDLDETRSVIKLRVMLVCLAEDTNELCGVGFRLESPHGDEFNGEAEEEQEQEIKGLEEGSHDFYHAQLIRDFGRGSSFGCPVWLPCTQPSFPLTAACPVTLVICLLLTLYGKRGCWKFISRDAGLLNWLKPYLNEIQPWIKWEALA